MDDVVYEYTRDTVIVLWRPCLELRGTPRAPPRRQPVLQLRLCRVEGHVHGVEEAAGGGVDVLDGRLVHVVRLGREQAFTADEGLIDTIR